MALARYFFTRVFAHELGHHHVYQYKHKRPLPGSLRSHEDRADALMYEVQGWARFKLVFGDA
jgi:predicted SprT family Zn-dependent metalloprotease